MTARDDIVRRFRLDIIS